MKESAVPGFAKRGSDLRGVRGSGHVDSAAAWAGGRIVKERVVNLDEALYRARSRVRRLVRGERADPVVEDFTLRASQIDKVAARMEGPLAEMFLANAGRSVWKWAHYFDVYEQHFSRFRGTPVRMLEIGVYKGGSLAMWRRYFGARATIFGVDIKPEFAGNAEPPNQVRIGSQDDPTFLRRVIEEMGGVDVVLDDGSHFGTHQRVSFEALFPLLSDGGVYVVEDLHTSYWRDFLGGYRRPISGVEFFKRLIDDMHHWYHHHGVATPGGESIAAIHFYDSMVAIEKGPVPPPVNFERGADAARAVPR
jgi:cephalosporin hydroxylase